MQTYEADAGCLCVSMDEIQSLTAVAACMLSWCNVEQEGKDIVLSRRAGVPGIRSEPGGLWGPAGGPPGRC